MPSTSDETVRENALSRWLDRLTLRSDVSPEARRAVLSLPGGLEDVRANTDFVRLGERVDASCLIVAGTAGRFGQTRDGERKVTAIHIPGDMADLHSAVLPSVSSALQAFGPCTILRIPHSAIMRAAADYPDLALAFWRDCTVDAAVLSQWAVVTGRLTAAGRIAHLACELAYRSEVNGTEAAQCFAMQLNQQQLGEVTALTAVHVNRMVRQLRESGLASVTRPETEIWDLPGLARLGEFNPRYLHLHRADDA